MTRTKTRHRRRRPGDGRIERVAPIAPVLHAPAAPSPNVAETGRAPWSAKGKRWKIDWQMFFTDARLKIIELSLQNNRDLRRRAQHRQGARAVPDRRRQPLSGHQRFSGGQTAWQTADDLSQNRRRRHFRQYTPGIGFSSFRARLLGRVGNLRIRRSNSSSPPREARRSVHISLSPKSPTPG